MSVPDSTILLAEDDPNDVVLMQRAFSKAGLVQPLQILRDGKEVVDYLARNGEFADQVRYPPPSLLLLDLNLPKKSGLEVLEWIRAQGMKSFPVIVLTSSQQTVDVERAYALGVNAYIVKPNGFEGLLELAKSIRAYWIILNKRPEDPDIRPSPPGWGGFK